MRIMGAVLITLGQEGKITGSVLLITYQGKQ